MRNPGTLVHGLGSVLTENADAVLFLTATPVMLGNENLFHLLRLLAPDKFDDQAAFAAQNAPSRYVNEAARQLRSGRPLEAREQLRCVEATDLRERFLRDPRYTEVLDDLKRLASAPDAAGSDVREQVRVLRSILDLHPLGAILTRTTKRM